MKIQFGKTTSIILGTALAIVIWISGILIGQEQTITMLDPESGLRGFFNQTRIIKINLMLDYGDGRIKTYTGIKLNYGSSLFKLLNEAGILESEIKYDTDLNGEIKYVSISSYNSTERGKKWLVWINNNLQTGDLNKIKLRSKDIVELKFVKLLNQD